MQFCDSPRTRRSKGKRMGMAAMTVRNGIAFREYVRDAHGRFAPVYNAGAGVGSSEDTAAADAVMGGESVVVRGGTDPNTGEPTGDVSVIPSADGGSVDVVGMDGSSRGTFDVVDDVAGEFDTPSGKVFFDPISDVATGSVFEIASMPA